MQKTQYGFRKGKSTAQAIHCVRRAQDFAEKGGTKLSLVLLDWEKAFDKTLHEKLFEALERIGIDEHLMEITKSIYKKPKLKVRIGTLESEWHQQNTGIRQGCPLSPYLFLIVMAAMFYDIHRGNHRNEIQH